MNNDDKSNNNNNKIHIYPNIWPDNMQAASLEYMWPQKKFPRGYHSCTEGVRACVLALITLVYFCA